MDEVMVLIKPGEDLPIPGKPMAMSSELSGVNYEFKVKKIVSLRWRKDGALIVEMTGTRKEIKGGAKNE